MKKWYVIMAVLLAFIMISSTYAFAAGLDAGSLTGDSDPATDLLDSGSLTESSEPAEDDSGPESDDNQNSDGGSRVSIIGNIPPIADFTYNQSEDNEFVFNFIDLSTDPDGEVESWEWSFNDETGSTSDEQNPSYDFSHMPGCDVFVSLRVGDNGIPAEYNSTEKWISIPGGISIAEDLSGEGIPLTNGEQSSSQSASSLTTGSASSSSIQTTDATNLLSPIYRTTQVFDGSQILSKFLNVIDFDTGIIICGMGDDNKCDLELFVLGISPNPPEMNRRLRFTVNAEDQFENITECEQVRYKIVAPTLGINTFFDYKLDGYPKEIYFTWPDGANVNDSHLISICVCPKSPWVEDYWPDNEKIYDLSSKSAIEGLSTNAGQSLTSSSFSVQVAQVAALVLLVVQAPLLLVQLVQV